ncbi:MAG: hypothetical protein DRO88_04155 [Promethearchaeia archaeon]|nr:MAG: hypothetical protein DRO88_04155 [Candidatus Lokiarchaeia archaeon]
MVEVGTHVLKIDGPVTRETIKNYAKASGDHNPIHVDDDFASKVGLNGVIAHGMLSFGYGAHHLNDFAEECNGQLINLGCEMRGMVRPGDWILTHITVKAINDDILEIEMIQNSKMPLKLEKDGKQIETFEALEKGWVSEKEQDLIKTEETENGTLTYREALVNKGWGKIRI